MFTGSIKISELNSISSIVGTDFFPLVQSSSMTTFRTGVSTLNNWFMVSGSTLSASWASASISAIRSISASFASASISASFASVSISASYAPFTQAVQVSASWASASLSSSYATTSSATLVALTSSFALSSSTSATTISASYSISASYAPTIGDTVPIGTIMAFASSSAPNNWLECNGDAKSTASYVELYNAITNENLSSSYGYLCDSFGNRSGAGGYFKLPDFRGEFLRGWDNNRGIDLTRYIGSSQTDSFKSHYHSVNDSNAVGAVVNSWAYGDTGNGVTVDTDLITNPTGGNETRPRNVAVMYCIKYSNAMNYAANGATLAGDVQGLTSATSVVAIQGTQVTSSAPTHGQVLQYTTGSGKWVPTDLQSVGLVAWASILVPTASNYSSDNPATVATGNANNKPIILNSYNITDVSWTARTITASLSFLNGRPGGSRTPSQNGPFNFLITLANPVSNLNYMVIGNGYEPDAYGEDVTFSFYPFQQRTNTQFTMSMAGHNDMSGGSEYLQMNFLIYA